MQYLVLTHDAMKIEWDTQTTLLHAEARKVLELQTGGHIRNIWFNEDNDAVLLLEADSHEAAKKKIDELPLVMNHMIKYEILALYPYTGYTRLV